MNYYKLVAYKQHRLLAYTSGHHKSNTGLNGLKLRSLQG